jgi:hypothetical protein
MMFFWFADKAVPLAESAHVVAVPQSPSRPAIAEIANIVSAGGVWAACQRISNPIAKM